ncbi:MAG: PH domain-containing protein [Xanthomonadales bacterium]|nr:PH domain-containing protein [Xanthomonadales bacterium]
MEPEAKEPASAHRWRRTSPVAVVFYVLKFARHMVTDGLPAVAPAVAVFATADGWMKTAGIGALSALALIGAVGAILSYLRFRFRFEGQQLLVRRGVIKREQLNVDFDRIQDVAIDEPFYARPFGLAMLKLDTAGSAGKEITLPGIPLANARAMRNEIISVATRQPMPETVDAEEPSDHLLTRSNADIARYGLTANGLLWVAIVFGAFVSAVDDDQWLGPAVNWLTSALNLDGVTSAIVRLGAPGAVLLVLLGLLVAGLLLSLFSILGALWKYADYRLSVDGNTYHRRSGLVSKQEQTLKRAKIQAAVWRQNVVAYWLSRINLQLRLVSAGEAANAQGMPIGQPVFLVPALTDDEAHDMSAEFLPELDTRSLQLSQINRRRYMSRNITLAWMPFIAAASFAAYFLNPLAAPAVFLAGLALATGCVYLRWKRYGYGTVNAYGCLREGFFGYKTTLFPLRKLQRADLRQSPSQRRAGLANLTVHLASHSITMPYMDLNEARRFADLALHQAESSEEGWF